MNGCPAVPAPTNRLVWTSDSCDAALPEVVVAPAAAHLIQVDAAPTEINTGTRAFAVYVTYAVVGHDEPLALKASFKLGRLQQHSFELVPLAAASGSIRFVVGIANEPLQVAPDWKLLLYTVPLNDTRYSQHYEKTTHFIDVIQAPATDGPTPGPTAATPNPTPGPTSVAPSPAPTTAGPTPAPSPGPTTATPTPAPSPGPTVPVPVAVTSTTAAPATPVPTQGAIMDPTYQPDTPASTQGAIMDPTYQPDTPASSTSSSTPDPITAAASSSSTPDLTTAVASDADAIPSVRIATHLFFPSTGWLQEVGNPGLLQALEFHFSSYLNLTTGIDWGSAFATSSPAHIRISFYVTSEATWAQVRWATIQNRICLVDSSSAGSGGQNRSCAQLSAVGSATVSPGLSVTAPTDDSNLEAASDVSLAKLIGISAGGVVLFFVALLVIKWTMFPAPGSKRTSDSRQGLVKQGTRTSVITYDGYAGEDGHRGDSPFYATCDSVLTSATPANPDIYAQIHKGDLSRSAALPNIRMTSAPRPGSANKSRGISPEYATCGSITPNTSIAAVFSEHPLVVQRQATKFVKPPSVTKPSDTYIEGGTPLATGASRSKMAGVVPDWQPGEEYDVDTDAASKPLSAKYLAPGGDTPSPAATPPPISPQGLGANGVELVNGAYDEFKGSDEEL